MRNRYLALTAALLLIPQLAAAQQPAAAAAATGTVDVGGMFTTTDGDEARYERYRDTRDGAYTSLALNRETGSYLFNASASHIGYRDQRYAVEYSRPRLDFGFHWISLPLNYSYLTRTPYTTNGATLTLPDSAQAAVQGPTNATNDGTAVGVPCAPGAPPASCTAATVAAAKANRSIYNTLADPFDLRHTRHTAMFGVNYAATSAVDLDAKFISSMRDGQQPWNASFAFNNAVELPQPIDQRTNDLSVGASWANPKGMVRVGWDGSWFNNSNPVLVWDNPIRLTDFNNGNTLFNCLPNGTGGPWDCNGYSNGNGPAQGREALAPSNMMSVVSAVAMYKLATRTTLNGTLQFTNQRQDEALIPWTINSVIDQPATFANFPHLAALPRSTADAEAQGVNALINLSTRPTRRTNVTVRYRYNRRDVQTPIFDATEYVRFDAVPEEIEEGFSDQFDNSRHLFDANMSFSTNGWGTVRAGYGREDIERHGRGFADVAENIFRLSYDAYSNQYVTVRGSFDVGRRRGSGVVETGVDYEEGPGGTQPTLRYYDEADRDRTRGSVILTAMPAETVDVFFQFAGGRDKYRPDTSVPVDRPGELFGLHRQTVTSYNVGANVHPSEMVSLGANYGRDTFSSLQRSRNANPPPDPQWTDPSRDWTLDNDDKVNNFGLYVDLTRPLRNTDIRFGYDYSDSDNSFVHGGPRIAALTAASQFIPLPDVENTWHRATADVSYFITSRIGVGVGYYFEKLDVVDFNTIDTDGPVGFAPATGDPRLDWLGGLTLGYGNRPYSGHTGFVRVLYRF
ncbi:MAG: MtrB/PioB family outer membrane beta-barrel protein [Vicinamibacterales bacterium]